METAHYKICSVARVFLSVKGKQHKLLRLTALEDKNKAKNPIPGAWSIYTTQPSILHHAKSQIDDLNLRNTMNRLKPDR